MRNYFPFTDYDFYAYLTSGLLALSVVDFAFNDASLIQKSDWSFWQISVGVAVAYVVGHVIASLSQLFFETFFVNKVCSKPMNLQLGFRKPSWFERFLGVATGRYYGPFSEDTRSKILKTAASIHNKPDGEGISAEDVFLLGHQKAFSTDGARQRLDDFRNQYGFCRNIAFVFLISIIVFACKAWLLCDTQLWFLAGTSALGFFVMFVRFVKFLSSFQAEALQKLLVEKS